MKNQYFTVKYDQFPFICIYKLGKKVGNGMVEIEGAPGYWFKPIRFLSEKQALELKEKLDELTENRRIVLKALEEGFKSQLHQININS